MAPAIGCAVLAAGASRRLGRPKQLVLVDGVSLIRHAALAATQARFARVAIVLGANAADVALALEGLDVERVDNPDWAEGMAASVRVAAAWARRHALDALLVAVADQPRLSSLHLDALIVASNDGERTAAPPTAASWACRRSSPGAGIRGSRFCAAMPARAISCARPGTS